MADKYPEIKILPSFTYVNWKKLDYDFPAIFGTNDLEELTKAKKNGKLFYDRCGFLFECVCAQANMYLFYSCTLHQRPS